MVHMPKLTLIRSVQIVLQLAVTITTTTLFAQAEPRPTAAETAEPAPPAPSTQEAPLLQLEAPPGRVVAPPVATHEVAPRTPTPLPAAPPQMPACDTSATPSPCEQPADAYHHDGFYLRISGETQYLAVTGSGPNGSASLKGLGSD